MLDKFVYLTLYASCFFSGIVAMWLMTFCTEKDWPLWVVFMSTVLLSIFLLRRMEIPFPIGPP